MRAIVYGEAGPASVLHPVDRQAEEPGEGDVRIRLAFSGINPADWKGRAGYMGSVAGESVPHVDGSGTIEAVGAGVTDLQVGDRVWTVNLFKRPTGGTAQELLVVPASLVFPLPDTASFELGASIGVPGVTSYRALTTIDGYSDELTEGSLAGATILVAGGAGGVGHVAIQLARWAGATVIATVSGPEKATLASAAGAHHVVVYRDADVAGQIRAISPNGVDAIVEVAAGANIELDAAVLKPLGSIAVYDNAGDGTPAFDAFTFWFHNARIQFIAIPALPRDIVTRAGAAITAALGALSVGDEAGLPVHVYPLEEAAAAHTALESGTVGKVLLAL